MTKALVGTIYLHVFFAFLLFHESEPVSVSHVSSNSIQNCSSSSTTDVEAMRGLMSDLTSAQPRASLRSRSSPTSRDDGDGDGSDRFFPATLTVSFDSSTLSHPPPSSSMSPLPLEQLSPLPRITVNLSPPGIVTAMKEHDVVDGSPDLTPRAIASPSCASYESSPSEIVVNLPPYSELCFPHSSAGTAGSPTAAPLSDARPLRTHTQNDHILVDRPFNASTSGGGTHDASSGSSSSFRITFDSEDSPANHPAEAADSQSGSVSPTLLDDLVITTDVTEDYETETSQPPKGVFNFRPTRSSMNA